MPPIERSSHDLFHNQGIARGTWIDGRSLALSELVKNLPVIEKKRRD
jgi:hypothetical protein